MIMDEHEKTYLVKAELPVIESMGFANEIRKATSGQAIPNLKFDRYEVSKRPKKFHPPESNYQKI